MQELIDNLIEYGWLPNGASNLKQSFLEPALEKEKEQIRTAYGQGRADSFSMPSRYASGTDYFNQTYNQNELPKTYINSVEVKSDNNNSVMTNGEWNLKANYTNK